MAKLSPSSRIGRVELTVSDEGRARDFYEGALGLDLDGAHARTLSLHERRGAKRYPGTTGLFHVAILFPSRADLASAIRRVAAARHPFQGFADHDVSEAAYLADPDGNGLELYRDRPRESWIWENGRVRMRTLPLDLEDLLRETGGADRAPDTTTIGHVHLHVRDLAEAEGFWSGEVGFDLTARYPGQASFLSAGGYHHHLAVNVWAGVGAPPPPEDAVGLRSFEIVTVDGDGTSRRDPSENPFRLVTEARTASPPSPRPPARSPATP